VATLVKFRSGGRCGLKKTPFACLPSFLNLLHAMLPLAMLSSQNWLCTTLHTLNRGCHIMMSFYVILLYFTVFNVISALLPFFEKHVALVFALHSPVGAEDGQKESGAQGDFLPCLSMSCCFFDLCRKLNLEILILFPL
jgi:hypothetical protein